MFVYLLFLHAETARSILVKFDVKVADNINSLYFLFATTTTTQGAATNIYFYKYDVKCQFYKSTNYMA